ncbi:RHS repeat-associated core domain-containing protein [Streptomyces sp. NPDC056500]|uniref:RHS repeat-associated core domain-containing protein n=1 Tax=Streptomyces sp. NPDC056500 TaxID=3345840 RepID=UPI00368CB59D
MWSSRVLRHLSGGIALVLAVSLVDGVSTAVAAESREKPAKSPKGQVTQAADIMSAGVAARLSGKRVEALSERTETSTTWVNKDGSLTTELVAGPVRFKDKASGRWRTVDLELTTGPKGAPAPRAHPNGLTLAGPSGVAARSLKESQASSATDLVTLGEEGQRITLRWKGGLPTPKLNGARAEYTDAVPGADVVVEATRTGFEQFVEIKERPRLADYTYTLPLQTQGLSAAQQPDGSIRFTDRAKKIKAVMPAPVMWDSTVDSRSGEHTRRVKVDMKVVQRKGHVDLVITPDAGFLADPKTKYPVIVDPSTSALANTFDTYVQQGETVDWSADTELDLGNPGTTNPNGTPRTARSFISWNTTGIRDALVTDAKLSVWNFHSGNTTCSAQPWEVWSTGAASTASRWTAQPAWTAVKATSNETRGNPGCTAAPDGWINAEVSTLVQEWASAQVTRGHMGLRATSETATTQWKRVNSANATLNPPKLVVTYNYRPRTGTRQEAGPPYFSYGGAYTVNTVRPTLRDTFVDANGDKVNGTFQIFDSVTNTQVGSVLVSPFVPSGQVASVTVPAGVLTDGKTYKFRTNPYDGAHYNVGWSAWKTFTVDATAPSAPSSVVSTDYPSTAWVKGAGQAGVFTVTPPSADHNWLEWSLDGTTWTKVHTGGASAAKAISVTPSKDGTHTLQVRMVDKGDNKSEPAEYTFHAGPGGFLQPGEGERTARRLPLVAEADAAVYSHVSFSWRRSAADPWSLIPTADVTSGGTALGAWPVALTGGKNAPLVWNATDTVDPDGTVQLRANFTGPSSATGSTDVLTIVVDRNANGAASEEIGPGTVNLLTGDLSVSHTDASAFGLHITRSASSRSPERGAQQAGQAPIFGKEWASGTVAELTDADYSHLRRISDTAVDVVMDSGNAIHFTANASQTGWIPEPGSEDLTLQGSVSGSLTLSDSEGTVTEFTKPTPSAASWPVSSTLLDGLSNSTTTVVSETITVGGNLLARPKRIIAPTTATNAATCTATPATKGCRALEFVYGTATTATGSTTASEFGDFLNQVKEIRLWSTVPGTSAATSQAVASYRYDLAGRLRQHWNPNLSQATQVQYSYDSAGRLTRVQSATELPWELTYGTAGSSPAAGAGMLLKASRSGLQQGTADVEQGSAATSVVYDVPLTGAGAPHAMGAADVKGWGQLDAPTDATAVLPADTVPSSHSGSALTTADFRRATVYYLGASGREVNTAKAGGHITTTEYDEFGNMVRELTASGRAIAVETSASAQSTRADLGIASLSASERAGLLSTTSEFNEAGTRKLEELGPLHRVDLTADLKSGSTTLVAAGTSVTARSRTVNEYDAGRPTDGTAKVRDQITRTTTGAQVREHPGVHGETRVVQTVYDWAKGLPTQTIKDPGGLAITETTQYDSQGRITEQRLPNATGSDAGTRVTTYWSPTGTGSCNGRPEWADLVCSTGPAGAITGGGAQPTSLPTSTTEYDWWGNVAKVTETVDGTTRTTTTAHDGAGRPTTETVTGGLGQTVPTTTSGYDPDTGQIITVSSPTGGTITKAYDRLGRQISYTDADGGVTTTEYDLLNRPVKVSDNVPSNVVYTYDHTLEPRGLATKVTDSIAGAFHASYDANGTVIRETLPGGYTLNQIENPSGATVERTYTRDSDNSIVYSDTTTESVHGQVTSHTGWSDQSYRYDAVGRLTGVDDTANTLCTKRGYVFDSRSNRTTLNTATATPGADCPAGPGSGVSHSYDSADRLVDTGYTYDVLGRSTAMPGSTFVHYANDLVYQQVASGERQTWQLDSALRFRSWKVESGSGTTWTEIASKRNHYANDDDNPRWIIEDTVGGAVTRNVEGPSGQLSATTGKTGDTVLQLSTIQGDIALRLPLDSLVAPVALDHEEYGSPRTGQPAARYGWLGARQRSSETLTGLTLMGVRLYNPTTGRFLSSDPVYGGSANAYEYALGDPRNNLDLDGRWVGIALRGGLIAGKWLLRNSKKKKNWSQKNRNEHKKGKSKSSKDKHENAKKHGGHKKRGHDKWRGWSWRWAW